MSLSANGTPCSGPRWRPLEISASACFACHTARSAVMLMNAFSFGSSASMRFSRASVSSTGESFRERIRREASAMERSCNSDVIDGPVSGDCRSSTRLYGGSFGPHSGEPYELPHAFVVLANELREGFRCAVYRLLAEVEKSLAQLGRAEHISEH